MRNSWFMCALAPFMAAAASAQQAPALDAAQRAAVVEDIGRTLIEGYIYADVGEKLAGHLEARLSDGAYDELTDRAAFASQLSTDLFDVADDKHLRVMPTRSAVVGGASAQGGVRRMVRRVGPGGAARGGAQGGSGEAVGWPGMPDFRLANHGFQELRILDGNVGYLDLRSFSPFPDALARVDAAMTFFDGVDALIIDIGKNRGGAGTIVTYLSAYLFLERTHLVDTFQRGMEEPSQRWTDEKIAGRPRPELPVFVLTSGGTGSAAESFAFGLKVTDRITLVGECTAGAGHFGNNSMKPLAHGFEMFLPVGRAYDPATGKGFEGDGIAPHIEVLYAGALKKAHTLALAAGGTYSWSEEAMFVAENYAPRETGGDHDEDGDEDEPSSASGENDEISPEPIAEETLALFDYDATQNLDVEDREVLPMDGFDRTDLTYASPAGGRVPAYLYQPAGDGPFAGILLMHGLPGSRADVDRLGQRYARTGAVVLSISAPWARSDGPRDDVVRFTADDRAEQIQLIQDMRRGIDLLESFPWVDRERLGYVGGSYGGAMGGLLAGVEKRLAAYVLMVGDGGLVAHFTGADDVVPPLDVDEAQWEQWLQSMGEIEPIRFVGHAAPAHLLFQNGEVDQAVPAADARLYQAAGSQPKTTKWYETGHAITPPMLRDQVQWLAERIGIDPKGFPGL